MVLFEWKSLSLIKCPSNGIILVNKEFEREINDPDKSLQEFDDNLFHCSIQRKDFLRF